MTNSFTGSAKQQLASADGFKFKDIKEVPSKIAFYSPDNEYKGAIYTRHKSTFNTKDEAKTFGQELKEKGTAQSIRIGNGIKVSGGSRKKMFFVYYLSAKGKVQLMPKKKK